ncbi:MAG: PHB depolymerase family esterase [Deltaproteobacteria bacterium]|nr:PHB depolymerase family esterase [Deltaproteobacteria bacterium]
MRALLLGLLLLAQACACDDTLSEVHEFGDNPGGLRMFEYVPELAAVAEAAPALVVMLHGCSQTHGVARSSGLLELSDERGFVVLAPEQGAFNNGNLCFNWFNAEDTGRAGGEAQSIGDMIDSARTRHGVDPARIFIAGLSAGAAMAVSVAASFPELIRGAASLAGGAHGCARSALDAAACMAGDVALDDTEWADRVRAASPAGGTLASDAWPRMLALQGDEDPIVNPRSVDAIVAQWATLHAVDAHTPSTTDTLTSSAGDIQLDGFGPDVQRITLGGVGHTLPISPAEGCGEEAAFVADLGFCALRHVVDWYGL